MIVREIFAKLGLSVDGTGFKVADALFSGLGKSTVFFTGAILAAGAGLGALILQQSRAAKEISDMSEATGLSTDELQQWRKVAARAGVDNEQLNGSIFKLARTMYAAKGGSQNAAEAFSKLHVKITDGNGKLRRTDEVLTDVAASISKLPDGLEKTGKVMAVFGRGSGALVPVFNQGVEAIKKIKSEAIIMSAAQVASGKQLALTWNGVKNSLKGLLTQAIAPLLGPANELLQSFNEWVKANRKLIGQRMGLVIKALMFALKIFGFVLWRVIKIIDFFVSNMRLVIAVMLAAAAIMIVNQVRAAAAVGYSLLDLIKLYAWLGAQSLSAAAKSAAAWLASIAPLLLVGAAIVFVIALLHEFYGLFNGYDTVIGPLFTRFEKWANKWLSEEAPGGDPWWIVAIKAFVYAWLNLDTVIDDAIDYWKMALGRFFYWIKIAMAPVRAALNPIGYVRGLINGEALDDANGAAGNSSGYNFVPDYKMVLDDAAGGSPSAAAPARGGVTKVTQVNAPTQVTIENALYGEQDPDVLAAAQRKAFDDHMNDHIEKTLASVGQ